MELPRPILPGLDRGPLRLEELLRPGSGGGTASRSRSMGRRQEPSHAKVLFPERLGLARLFVGTGAPCDSIASGQRSGTSVLKQGFPGCNFTAKNADCGCSFEPGGVRVVDRRSLRSMPCVTSYCGCRDRVRFPCRGGLSVVAAVGRLAVADPFADAGDRGETDPTHRPFRRFDAFLRKRRRPAVSRGTGNVASGQTGRGLGGRHLRPMLAHQVRG